MSATHHPHAEPFKLKYHSTDLATDVLSVKGYRGKCACGWVGPVRSHHSHARDDSRRHRREEMEAENARPQYPEGKCRLRVEPHAAHNWQAEGLLTVDPPWFRCPGITSKNAAQQREDAQPTESAESS